MRSSDILRFAFRNFFRRKTRSILTILGVVIGTMSVVIMLSISEALDVGSVKQIEQWGSLTEIMIYQQWGGDENAPKLTDDLVARIRAIEHVVAINPMRTMYVQLLKGKEEAWVGVTSVDAEALQYFGLEIELGRFMEQDDSYELVMGYDVPFRFSDPRRWEWKSSTDWDYENETMIVNPLPFDPTEAIIKLAPDVYVEPGKPKPKQIKVQTVGVLKWSNSGQTNYNAVMNSSAFDKLEKELKKIRDRNTNGGGGGAVSGEYISGAAVSSIAIASPRPSGGLSGGKGEQEENKYESISVKADNMENVLTIQNELKEWGLQANSNMDSLEYAREQFAFIQMILGGIGLVAFLVAALGIANTMIMSTYERTREIGVMKVMGCKLGNVLAMFLCESAIIGLFGGAIGVGFSLVASYVLNTFVDGSVLGFSSWGGAQYDLSIIPLWLIIAGLVFSTIVGIVSGLYPSIRAMRMSVLEAIKNE